MDEQLLKALEEIGIEVVLKKLHAFTYSKLQHVEWPSRKESGPRGEQAKDFVNEAIRLALDLSEKRKWDPENCPNPIAHLCGVVRGLISNALEKAQNDAPDVVDELLELVLNNDFAADQLISSEIEKEQERRFFLIEKDINSLKQSDDDLIDDVFLGMHSFSAIMPIAMSELHGIDVNTAKKYKKRIMRVIEKHS